MAWAYKNSIVNGMTETLFMPDEVVTREQMCALLSRYLKYIGYTLSTRDQLSFADRRSVAEWSKLDVAGCVNEGIITGYPDNTFRPQNSATRAENAAVIRRVIRMILEREIKAQN